jgi:hypothetical protein
MTIIASIVIPEEDNLPHPLGLAGFGHDPRNFDFRALVRPGPRTTLPNHPWYTSLVLDQGSEPRCTTEAAVGLLETNPNRLQYTPDRFRFDEPAERQAAYLAWQRFDPWATVQHDGSTIDAPFRGLRELGVISGWRFLFGEAEVREYVTWYGPVAVGTVWRYDMFYPHPDGSLPVTGPVAGGHAYRLVQYSKARHAYRVVNSWGKGWGQNGRAWIRDVDLAALLSADGEAVTVAVA